MADDSKTPWIEPQGTETISTTGQPAPHGTDGSRPERQPGVSDARLDEALEETFPSSDPISVKVTK